MRDAFSGLSDQGNPCGSCPRGVLGIRFQILGLTSEVPGGASPGAMLLPPTIYVTADHPRRWANSSNRRWMAGSSKSSRAVNKG